MIGGARRTGLCQELQHCWVFHESPFHVCIKNGPPPKGHLANLTTVGSVGGIYMGQHPCGTLESMLRQIETVPRANGGATQEGVPNVLSTVYI